MAITQAITCDVCGKVKGEVNHWYTAEIYGKSSIYVRTWSEKSVEGADQHLCGQECVIQAVNKWMQDQAA